jgi:hypothetical protein
MAFAPKYLCINLWREGFNTPKSNYYKRDFELIRYSVREATTISAAIIPGAYRKTRIQDLFEMTTISIDKQIKGFEYLTEYFEVKGKKED